MPRLLSIVVSVALFLFGSIPAFSQSPPPKPGSPGEIAAADKLAMEKRAICQREARAQKLTLMKRRSFVKNCVKR